MNSVNFMELLFAPVGVFVFVALVWVLVIRRLNGRHFEIGAAPGKRSASVRAFRQRDETMPRLGAFRRWGG